MFTYRATVARIVDADTLVLVFDLGFHIRHETRVRLLGINCPERGTVEGASASAFVVALLPPGTECTATTTKDRTDKYGRYLVTIALADGSILHDVLLEAGHGVPA